MYVQGSNASSSSTSSSNTQAHNHIPDSTVGTITYVPYGTTSHIQDNSFNNSLPPPNFQQPFYHAPSQPFYPPPPPTLFHGESYGYGLIGNPSDQNNSGAQCNGGIQFGARGSNGNQYRGNNYRNNNSFRRRGYGSSNSR